MPFASLRMLVYVTVTSFYRDSFFQGTSSLLGISLDMSEIKELSIDRRGFKGMNRLQFLKFYTNLKDKEANVRLPHGLDYLPRRLRLLHWEGFPVRCLPSDFIPNHLIELAMVASKLEVLWSRIQVHVTTEF